MHQFLIIIHKHSKKFEDLLLNTFKSFRGITMGTLGPSLGLKDYIQCCMGVGNSTREY